MRPLRPGDSGLLPRCRRRQERQPSGDKQAGQFCSRHGHPEDPPPRGWRQAYESEPVAVVELQEWRHVNA